MEKLVIDMGEVNLVVEKYEGVEFIVYFQDKKTDCVTQDIVTVSQSLNGNGELIPNAVYCLVWADNNDENYTHKFCINKLPEADDE